MIHSYKNYFLLMILSLSPMIISRAQNPSILSFYRMIEGSFVTAERPEDFKAVLLWTNSIVSDSLNGDFIHHKRMTVQSLDKPYNQQLWKLEKRNNVYYLKHYTIINQSTSVLEKNIISLAGFKVVYEDKLDLPLKFENGNWSGLVTFTDPDYLSHFVINGYKAMVKVNYSTNELYYHLIIEDKDGKQVFGPKQKGYTLRRKG